TGTGKTASFTLPMIEILAQGRARARMPRSLILEPTRELAAHICVRFETYGKYHKLTMALLIGGVSFDEQNKLLDRGVDVLIATPGRLLDHAERGKILLRDVKTLVIDEADRMLDMGFMPDVEKIVGLLPTIRQTLFFSATMPDEIRRLSKKFLMNPKEVSVDPPASAAQTVKQSIIKCQAKDKRDVLRSLIKSEGAESAIIFCNRKRDIGVLQRSLERHGLNAGALHGDMDQFSRTKTLAQFKAGEITFLVCSDVAARGLDIPSMGHVFNFDVPTHAEDYIHRIGRTGRAGRSGRAITLATREDSRYLDAIHKMLGKPIPVMELSGKVEAEPKADAADAEESVLEAVEAPETLESPEVIVEAKQDAELPPAGQRSRSPRRRSARSTRENAPAPRSRQGHGGDFGDSMPDDNNQPFGKGDHVPAFLLREPPR
ncbi:MAG: DEAD/DEAH box helicase, partial [Proteobacteria bacterium]|nr:DEAD/DEAH box helicase [Pseudomonadota bacterium]